MDGLPEPVTGVVVEVEEEDEGREEAEVARRRCLWVCGLLLGVAALCCVAMVRAALCGVVAALLGLRWAASYKVFNYGANLDGCCSRHIVFTLSAIFSSLNIVLLPAPLYTGIASESITVTPFLVSIVTATVLSNAANIAVCWKMCRILKKYNLDVPPPIVTAAVAVPSLSDLQTQRTESI